MNSHFSLTSPIDQQVCKFVQTLRFPGTPDAFKMLVAHALLLLLLAGVSQQVPSSFSTSSGGSTCNLLSANPDFHGDFRSGSRGDWDATVEKVRIYEVPMYPPNCIFSFKHWALEFDVRDSDGSIHKYTVEVMGPANFPYPDKRWGEYYNGRYLTVTKYLNFPLYMLHSKVLRAKRHSILFYNCQHYAQQIYDKL